MTTPPPVPPLPGTDLDAVPYRPVRLGTLTPHLEPSADGSMRLRSLEALAPFERRATDRLVRWATTTPDRVFLMWRTPTGTVDQITYGAMYESVRRLGQALLDLGASNERPVVILSGNSLAHAQLMLAGMFIGATVAPVSPAYSLVSRDFGIIKMVMGKLTPALVFAEEGVAYERAMTAVVGDEVPIVVAGNPPAHRVATGLADLLATPATPAVDEANARVTPDTVAKILFTSGSTGVPKGVINTHRMLTSNQQMLAQVLPFLADEPPMLVDWLPWHHTFGGNHNFGIVMHNGGTLFIDEGRPLPGAFQASIRNLREARPTLYLNVPRGFDELIKAMHADAELRAAFYSRLRLCFYAAASLSQAAVDAIQAFAVDTCGARIVLLTSLGSTETAPLVITRTFPSTRAGAIGLPAPGTEARLVPVDEKLELRVKGPNITPGYYKEEALTAKAFDEDGYYRLGDAVKFVDVDHPVEGLLFDGRIAEDFKLASGTWVNVGVMRARTIGHFAPLLRDAVIAGHDRDDLALLVVPDLESCRAVCGVPAEAPTEEVLQNPVVRDWFLTKLNSFNRTATGNARRYARALLMVEPPQLDAQEMTDKGSLNQRAILSRRAALVEAIYAATPGPDVLVAD